MSSYNYFVCKTCKKRWVLGNNRECYHADNLEEFARESKHKPQHIDSFINQRLRTLLLEHSEHDTFSWNDYGCYVQDGHLWLEGGYNPGTLYVENYKDFELIDDYPD